MFVQNISSESSDITEEIGSDENQLDKINCSATLEKPSSNSLMMRIFTHGKELVLIFALLLTTFATVQNNSPKISRPVAPNPFFSRGSLIEDYYYGHLSAAQNKVGLSEISFIFYYAPWSQESRHARATFEHVSRLFYKEAYFAAINCWQPGSECRHQYSKITQWPILMAYQRNGFGIQYQKNLWTDGALTKFVASLLNPFERLTTPEDLMEMMSSKDCVVVAFLDIHSYPRHYKSYVRTALKFLERDPFNEIGFGVVVGETAVDFGVSRVPTLRAYLWNETVEYDGNLTWSSRELINWIQEHVQQVTIQLSPPGTKSSSIGPYIKQGPILIVFTPRNFYAEFSDPYVMMRQLGMEYYNCKNDEWVREVAHDYLFARRKENRENYKLLQEQCSELVSKYQRTQKCTSSSLTSTASYAKILNSSKNFEAKLKNVESFCEIDQMSKGENCDCMSDSCSSASEYKHTKYTFKSTKSQEIFPTSILDNSEDAMSPESINKYNFRRKCDLLRQSERKSDFLFIDDPDTLPLELVSGLACRYNKTFTLISMDSNNFHTFAERLGIDILEMENKTAAMIMDQDAESTYLLEEAVNLNSLSRFIYTYHRGGLTRFLRTNSIQYSHTHFFDINEFLSVKEKERFLRNSERDKKVCKAKEEKKDFHVVIREINSEDFDNAVVRSNNTIVILFYSTNCAFCSMMSHSLLTVSRILEQMPSIEFLRIDGDKNDLPWHYTMAEFPSLLVFPRNTKTESRKFPSKMPITVNNVLGFVLANLNRSMRLLGLVMACNYKRPNTTNDCVSTIQEEITDTISFALREWRKHSRKRSAILRIIKGLKEIYLKLFRIENSCDFIEIERDVVTLDRRWQKVF